MSITNSPAKKKSQPLNLTGKKYGTLTAKQRKDKAKPPQWICQCDCGNTVIARTVDLTQGNTITCPHCLGEAQQTNTSSIKTTCLRKDNTVYIKYKGVLRSLKEWSEYTNLPVKTITSRLYSDWTIPEIFADAELTTNI